MAKQDINIGVEGNDGTGDSIRESFKKVNENFTELYAVFGVGGQITFTTLSDTPDVLTPNTVPLVNGAGTQLGLAVLGSNSDLPITDDLYQATDTITFKYDVPGKLIISSSFTEVSDDISPTIGGPMNAAGFGIANVAITTEAANEINTTHNLTGEQAVNVDDLVISKGYADQRYITSGLPLRIAEEPSGKLHYTWTINRYVDNTIEILNHYDVSQSLQATGHGLESGSNGLAIKFNAEDTDPTGLVSGTTYYLRVVNENRLMLFTEANKAFASGDSDQQASDNKINVAGVISGDDVHTLVEATLDDSLAGNFLTDVGMPRNSVTRRQGDSMTGPLYLNDHPGELSGEGAPNGVEDLQAATKFYVDNTAYSSPEVLFVSTKGDDTMAGVPPGKEGTSFTYAFKTINAAAQRADTLVRSAPATPGTYMQKLTHTGGQSESRVIRADVDVPVFSQARNLTEKNRKFVIAEVTGFINFTFPNFTYDIDLCERDVGLLVDALALDINRGQSANFLTRQAAERYYSSVSGRIAITSQLTETLASINFGQALHSAILQNNMYQAQTIDDITRANPARVTTTGSHGWSDKNIVLFKNIGGMTEIEGKKLYIKKISDDTFELYQDTAFEIPYDTSAFTGYTSGGQVGLRFQLEEDQFFDDGIVPMTSATQTSPVRIVTSQSHAVSTDDQITITTVNGMTELNGNTYYVRRIDASTLDLYSDLASAKDISGMTQANPVVVSTTTAHGLINGTKIAITDVSGFGDPGQPHPTNSKPFYVGNVTSNTFELYNDAGLTSGLDGTGFDAYASGGQVSTNAIDGTAFAAYTSAGQISKETDAASNAQTGINANWNTIKTIIQNGIDAGDDIAYGSTYKIVVTNGSATYTDQTNPANADALPGKVIRGQRSEALGRIVKVVNDVSSESGTDPITGATDPNPTVFQVHLLSAKDFEDEEPLEYGNFVKDKQVTIRVETGVYEEDYPIKLGANVSLKGDEFRRVIIKPKTEKESKQPRVSQSKWARSYFYRDNEFDGLPIARGGTPFFNQDGQEQGKFGYHYLYRPENPINIGSPITNPGGYKNAAAIMRENKDYIIEETIKFISDRFPDLVYGEAKCRRDTGLIIDGIINDFIRGGEEKTLENQGSYHELGYTDLQTQLGDSSQEIATEAAISNIASLSAQLLAGVAPTYTVQTASFTPTGAVYNETTGDLEITIGSHSLTTANRVEIVENGITFTCTQDGNLTNHAYPRQLSVTSSPNSDPAYEKKLAITATTPTSITVNVGASPLGQQYPHTFVSALSGAVTVNEYTAGSDEVLAIEQPDISLGAGESGTVSLVGQFIDKINFVFNVEYNPPLRNDQLDIFLMGDQTIVRNVTCRGHGGFMCVLDPEGQVLVKSPYIQTASSFSKSINKKVFSGGMYVDAYVGNLPTSILTKVNNFELTVQSAIGEGLRLREPQLPCPFYVEGRRYQVNAIAAYDSAQGTATLFLDANSNGGTGYDESQFSNPVVARDIFLQTAGNRSILANDFTQINDLGYGLVVNNAAFSEQVSTFTYYCHTAMYANNGSEIRGLNCSNGYGNFGLVAEGADPNEVPDQVILKYNQKQGVKVVTDAPAGFSNAFEDPSIYVFDFERPPTSSSIITIDHATAGTLNYSISSVSNLSDVDGDGIQGESGDAVITGARTVGAATVTTTGGMTAAHTDIATTSTKTNTVTGATQANPVVLTLTGHNLRSGDKVTMSGVGGMTQLNTNSYYVKKIDANTVSLYSDSLLRNTVDGTGFTAFTTGGTATATTGSGLTMNVTIDHAGSPDSAIIAINKPGSGYHSDSAITILGSAIGGSSPANDLTFNLSSIFGSEPGVKSNTIYKLDLVADTAKADDFFGQLREAVTDGTIIEYKDNFNHILSQANDPSKLTTRPSTAVNFDESDNVTYRSTSFSQADSFSQNLLSDEVLTTFEVGFDYVDMQVATSYLSGGFGSSTGDTKLAIQTLDSGGTSNFTDALRIARDGMVTTPRNQPASLNYPNAYSLVSRNIRYIQEETIAWINAQIAGGLGIWSGFTYSEAKCRRDLGYIIYGVAKDLLFDGNASTVINAKRYYVGAVGGQEAQTVAAVDQAKLILTDVINQSSYSSVNTVGIEQDTSGSAAEGGAATDGAALMDIVADAIEVGLTTVPTATGYAGGMIFLWDGKTHQVRDYTTVSIITTAGNISLSAGETVTQATSGAQGTVLRAVTTANTIELTDVSGTFDTTNQLSGSVSGALGANSTPSTIALNSYGFIDFIDYELANVNRDYATTGLNKPVPAADRILQAGLQRASTAEITIAISLLRATGHDFTQIGTGGFNDSNYPNVILGDPVNALATNYTDADTANSAQIWERRKGRVFFVTTDQDGFFRVGKFFSVDQSTGDITFAGEIGLSNANSLGFKKGVTINEFSADDGFADESASAVPTEKAIGSYINRVLGYNVKTNTQIDNITGNRIGPGFLPLNPGSTDMEGDLSLGSFKIENLGLPASGTDATNKNYVDDNVEAYNSVKLLRDFNELNPAANEFIVASGNQIIYTDPESLGTFAFGDVITGSISGATGTVKGYQAITDEQLGSVRKITFEPGLGSPDFVSTDVVTATGKSANIATTVSNPNVGVGYTEYVNASQAASGNDVELTVVSTDGVRSYSLNYKPGTIVNADVGSSAAIAQSKLNMQTAGTRANATAISQADLGLATFKDTEFTETSGFVELQTSTNTTTGIDPGKLQHIGTDRVLGRSDAGDGAVSAITFDTVLDQGGALRDSEFGAFGSSGDEVLIRTGAGTYGTTEVTTGNEANRIVKTQSDGSIRVNSLRLGGTNSYEVMSLSSTTLQLKTPGQATILEATGTDTDTLVVDLKGNLDVGETGITTTSSFQSSATAYATDGFVATDWIYTKFIEANDERDATSTGISLGAGTGFSDSAADTILLIANGTPKVVVGDTLQTIKTAAQVEGTLTVTSGGIAVNAGNILPGAGTPTSQNIGSSTNVWGTVYASVFSGTATSAQYADLAENYEADAEYEEGTVLVLGGEKEVTTTKYKGDRAVAGVVSTNPAHLMNSDLQGDTVVALALQGRVPCKILGKVNKGDLIVTSAIPGYGIVDNNPVVGTVIGKAIGTKEDDGKGIVEVLVGRV